MYVHIFPHSYSSIFFFFFFCSWIFHFSVLSMHKRPFLFHNAGFGKSISLKIIFEQWNMRRQINQMWSWWVSFTPIHGLWNVHNSIREWSLSSSILGMDFTFVYDLESCTLWNSVSHMKTEKCIITPLPAGRIKWINLHERIY